MEKDSGIVISDKLLHLCNTNNQQNKKYDVANSEYSELLHDMYESEYKVFDYPADCKKDSDKTYQRNKTQKRIALHINGKKASISWIQKYCKFFGCSADYLLGYIDKPTHEITDINKASGLSTAAIQKLLDNQETKIITDNLLRTNSIDLFIQALKASVQIKHVNNFIAAQLQKNTLAGITENDIALFKSNLESGNQSQIDQFAINCFKSLLQDEKIDNYFDELATKRYLDNLDFDTKN